MTAMRAAGPPSRCATRSTTHCTSRAASSSGAHGRPLTSTGVGSPIRRLNSRTMWSGSVVARRSAASPTTTLPSSPTNSTDGTALDRSPRLTISVSAGQAPTRLVAAAVRVVPTSMPNR